jgi:hypothetical protein
MAMDREKEMEGSGERGKISREMGRDMCAHQCDLIYYNI